MKEKTVIYAISGYKNSGKTTLMEKLIGRLSKEGFRVASIKHDGHDFDSDVPGTDSFRHRRAGAVASAVFSSDQVQIIMDQSQEEEEFWDEKRIMTLFSGMDFILLEGFKHSQWPKYFCRYPQEIPDEEEAYKELMALRTEKLK